MLISRFGDSWAAGYELPQLKAIDDWQAERPPIAEQVSGMGGAFEYYNDDNFPIAPLSLTKRFALKSTTYAGVETALNTMRSKTVGKKQTKLWALKRDGTTRLWTWAKCTRFKATEAFNRGQFLHIDVELVFYAKTGLWYSESKNIGQIVMAPTEGSGNHVFSSNIGNYSVGIKATVTNSGGSTNTVELICSTHTPSIGWQYQATLTASDTLVVDSDLYSVTKNGSDDYGSHFIMYDPDQLHWLWTSTEPDHNQCSIWGSRSGTTGTTTIDLEYYAAWVM
jgi:hypothetical protein